MSSQYIFTCYIITLLGPQAAPLGYGLVKSLFPILNTTVHLWHKISVSVVIMYVKHIFYVFVTAPYSPVGDLSVLFAGTWYLTQVDDKHRRQYSFTDNSTQTNGAAVSPTAEKVCSMSMIIMMYFNVP